MAPARGGPRRMPPKRGGSRASCTSEWLLKLSPPWLIESQSAIRTPESLSRMSDNWQRRREPDDVPTPLAVALSDFCRRAKSPASAAEVREALALLAPEDE